jgi:hypothetical protein
MSRAIAFAALVAALLAASGCGTSKKIASRIELANLAPTQAMTVYAEGHRTYELRNHALVDSVIRGTGTVSNGRNEAAFDGAIPLTSIHAIKTSSKNLLKGLAVAGVTVLFVKALSDGTGADAGLRATQETMYHSPPGGGGGGGESCPYVYAWNGERYVLEAEPFGIGLGKALELTTVHLLPSANPENGVVRLRLTNERRETHYVNSLDLFAIYLGAAPAAVLDDRGEAWPLSHPEAPAAVSDRSGRDILAEVASADGRLWECDTSALAVGSGYEDVLELAFVRPSRSATGSLVLTGTNTGLSTAMFSHMCRVVGDQAPELVHAIDTDQELIASLSAYLDDASLKASVWNGSDWENAGEFRPEANAVTFTRALRIRVSEAAGDTVRIRLRGMADVWKLDALSMDWTDASPLPMKRVELLSAIGPEREDVRELIAADDDRYAILVPPDRVELTYAAASGGRVVYAVAGRGYLHEWIPEGTESGLASPVSWVPEERRIDLLKELMKHRELALEPVYQEWRQARTKM